MSEDSSGFSTARHLRPNATHRARLAPTRPAAAAAVDVDGASPSSPVRCSTGCTMKWCISVIRAVAMLPSFAWSPPSPDADLPC